MLIILSMTLTLFYFVYLIWLLMPDLSSALILITFALVYFVIIGVVIKKPEVSIYCFLLIFLFFPHHGLNYFFFTTKEVVAITLHLAILSIAAFTICTRLTMGNIAKRKIPTKLNVFCNLFFTTYIITLLSTLYYQIRGNYLGVTIAPEHLALSAPLLFSYILLLGCIYFISKIEQIETIFTFIMAAGFTLLIDLILNFYLRIPLPYGYRAVHESGRFQGFLYNEQWMVGMIAFAAIGCTLYFIYSRGKYIFLGTVPLLFLPIIATYQRSNMFSAVCIVTLFLLLSTYFVKQKSAYVVTIVVGILASILVLVGGIFLEDIVSALQGETRPDYFLSYLDSWASRVGAYFRGLDVIYHFFPLGVGPGSFVNEFMASPALPIYFPVSHDWHRASTLFYKIASGRHTTGAHTFYIQFIGEYGLMGGIIELLFIYFCFSNFLSLKRLAKKAKYKYSNSMILSASVFAILVGIGVNSIYQHHTPYYIPIMFFYFSFLVLGKIE